MERLTERFSNGQAAIYGCGNNCKYDYKYCNNHLEDCPTINEIYEKLAAYEDAEEQGLLLRLPCKVGDTLWWTNAFGDLCSSKANCMFIEHGIDGIAIETLICNINEKEIGKTVFLTKEEAEQALAGMEKENE